MTLNQRGRALDKDLSSFTAVIMLRTELTLEAQYVFVTHTPDANVRFAITRSGPVTTSVRSRPDDVDANGDFMPHPPGYPANTIFDWGNHCCAANYASKGVCQYRNGEELIRSTMPPNTPSKVAAISSSVVAIGSTTCGNFMRGDIAEIFCFRRELSTEELHSWHDYPGAKYQIPVTS
jgi:hypothetical protein